MSDIYIGTGYDAVLVTRSSGLKDIQILRGPLPAVVAQRIQCALRCFLGETPYNRGAGIPYQQVIFQRGTSDQSVRTIYETRINRIRGVKAVKSLNIRRHFETRVVEIDGEVIVTTGQVAPFKVAIPVGLP